MAVVKGGFDGLLSLVLSILICMCVQGEVFWGLDDFWSLGSYFGALILGRSAPNGWVCVCCELSDLLFPVIRATNRRSVIGRAFVVSRVVHHSYLMLH